MAVNVKLGSVKRNLNTAIKVMMDMKNLGLIVLMGFTLYGIGWDTILRPNLDKIKSSDDAIQQQKQALSEKQDSQRQYGVLEQQLKNLEVQMIPVPPGNSSKVVSVSESSELLKLARGENRNEALMPPLEPPHDRRENVSLTPTANSSFDLLQPEAPKDGAQPAAAPEAEAGSGAAGALATSLPVEQYDYELKATGTYPALVDLLNVLVIEKRLIKINKIVITRLNGEMMPDARDEPNFPVKLQMVISLSMFLYAATQSPAGT